MRNYAPWGARRARSDVRVRVCDIVCAYSTAWADAAAVSLCSWLPRGLSPAAVRALVDAPGAQIQRHLDALVTDGEIFQGRDGSYYPCHPYYSDRGRPYDSLTICPEDVVIIDTETTGLNRNRTDEILELAIIDGTGATLFNRRFRPVNHVRWPDAQRIHGIGPEDVRDCPVFDSCVDEVDRIIRDARVVLIYNWGYDAPLLVDNGVDFPPCVGADVMLDFAEWYGEPSPWYEGQPRWQRLTTAAKVVGYGEYEAHGALADCRATLAVAKALSKRKPYNAAPISRFDACKPFNPGGLIGGLPGFSGCLFPGFFISSARLLNVAGCSSCIFLSMPAAFRLHHWVIFLIAI